MSLEAKSFRGRKGESFGAAARDAHRPPVVINQLGLAVCSFIPIPKLNTMKIQALALAYIASVAKADIHRILSGSRDANVSKPNSHRIFNAASE